MKLHADRKVSMRTGWRDGFGRIDFSLLFFFPFSLGFFESQMGGGRGFQAGLENSIKRIKCTTLGLERSCTLCSCTSV